MGELTHQKKVDDLKTDEIKLWLKDLELKLIKDLEFEKQLRERDGLVTEQERIIKEKEKNEKDLTQTISELELTHQKKVDDLKTDETKLWLKDLELKLIKDLEFEKQL